MNITVLSLDTVPTIGSIMGTGVDNSFIDMINQSLQTAKNTFGQMSNQYMEFIEKSRQKFIKNVIEPIKKNFGIHKKINLDDVNRIKPIVTEDDLYNIPPAMHLPILLHEPIKELLKQGRIDGWGYNPDWLPEEDVYGRLINNGKVEDLMSNLKEEKSKNGKVEHYFELDYTFTSEDPDLEFDEIDYIEQTRKFLDELLENTRIDPTSGNLKLRG